MGAHAVPPSAGAATVPRPRASLFHMSPGNFQWRSLKTRITLTTLAIFLLGIWTLTFYVSVDIREDMKNLLGAQQVSTVSLLAGNIDRDLTVRLQALERIAKDVTPEMLDRSAAMQQLLEQRPVLQSLFNGGTFAVRTDGTAIASMPLSAERAGVNFMDRDHIMGALEQGRTTIGRPVMGRTLNAPLFAIAVPIRDAGGRTIGALTGTTDLGKPNFLDGNLGTHYGRMGSFRLVAPAHRLIVTSTDKSQIMKSLPDPGVNPQLDRFLQGEESSTIVPDPLGEGLVLVSVKPIPAAGWIVGAALPVEEAFAPVRVLQQRMLLTAAALTLLAGVLSWWAVRRHLAPMLAAVHSLAAMSSNDQPLRPMPVVRDDEVSELISGFNRLIEVIGQREAALRESEEVFRTIFDQAAVGLTRVSPQGKWLEVNQKLCDIVGYPRAELVKLNFRDITHVPDLDIDLDHIRRMLDGSIETYALEKRYVRKSGQLVWVNMTVVLARHPDRSPKYFVTVVEDITKRKQAEERINELAFYDTLTGLPNRTLMLDRLKQAMTAGARNHGHGALLYIDLDHFKALNDTRGHDVGDLLLRQVAQRLKLGLREGDTVARLGGDEFIVLLTGLSANEEEAGSGAEAVANKILASLDQIYRVGEVAHRGTASIGVTLFKGDAVRRGDLIKQADLAMYKAKATGRNVVRFFDPTLESAVKERVALEHDLRHAIETRQFVLHYQAQVLDDGSVTGAEALLRWQHPERGMVLPANFIPLAEDTGLILALGHWVLHTACAQLALWARRPDTDRLSLAVNVSVHQFRQVDFVAQVLAILHDTGADPRRLKLELTESMLVSNVEDIIDKMLALKARGIGFSLDDFGTGYSSLSYLKRLPLDQLKIDRSFVGDVLTDSNDAAIATTIIALAASLGLRVIAEGVETQGQCDFLADAGCRAYQGYLFSRPLPLKEFETFATRAFSSPVKPE